MDDISSLSSENYTDSEDELKEESSYTSDSDNGNFDCDNELINQIQHSLLKRENNLEGSLMSSLFGFGFSGKMCKNLFSYLRTNDVEMIREKLRYEGVESWEICYAIDHSSMEVLKLLLFNFSESKYEESANIILNHGILSGKFEMVDYILDYYGNKEEVMDEALRKEVYVVVKYLFDAGVRVENILDKIISGKFFSDGDDSDDLFNIFIYVYDFYNVEKEEAEKLMIHAVKTSRMNICKFLAKKGVNVNLENGMLLFKLLIRKDYDNILFFGDFGLDVTIRDNYAIKKMIREENLEMVKFFCEMGANINEGFENACLKMNMEIIKYLYELGVDIHYKNDIAFVNSIKQGDFELVKYLVERGADMSLQNVSPLVVACQFNRIEILKYFVELGADIHAENEELLRLALGKYDRDMALYLLEKGADPNARDGGFFEEFSEDDEVIELLMAYGGKGMQIKYLIDTEIIFRRQLECPITRDELNNSIDLVGCGKCNNIFSRDGLEAWIKRGKKFCPMCREENMVFYKVNFSDTKE